MSDGRRKFEYDEESGVSGFIFLFFAQLIMFELTYGIIVLVQVNKAFGMIPVLGNLLMGCSILFLVSIPALCFSLYKYRRSTVTRVKAYLVLRTLYLTLTSLAVFIHTFGGKNVIGKGNDQFESISMLVLMMFVTPMAYSFGFGIPWYVYFCRSKRVKSTYLDNQSVKH